MSTRTLVPVVTVGALLAVLTVATNFGANAATFDRAAVDTFNAKVLRTVGGLEIHQVFDPGTRTVRAFVEKGNRKIAPKNGTYKISSGGAIKIQDGLIVWDAFGVIARLNGGDAQALDLVSA